MSGPSTDTVHQPATFAFTPQNLEKVRQVIARYPAGRQRSAVMPLLDIAQRQEGWVSRAAMDVVAGMLEMPAIKVYEVATFYTMYNLKPVGKHHLQVCTNLPCRLRGADEVLHACRRELGISPGETTPDGSFTLSECECLGACVNAPVAWVGDDYYEDLDAESAKALIETLKKGGQPRPGSQTGRQGSAPAGGPTTLTTLPGGGN